MYGKVSTLIVSIFYYYELRQLLHRTTREYHHWHLDMLDLSLNRHAYFLKFTQKWELGHNLRSLSRIPFLVFRFVVKYVFLQETS